MNTYNKGFDDVRVVPVPSTVISRDMVDLSVKLGNLLLQVPIIASPMKGITGVEVIIEVAKAGGIGILHRFSNPLEHSYDLRALLVSGVNFGYAVGLNDIELGWDDGLIAGAKIVCIDVANGYLNSVKKRTEEIKNYIVKNNYDCLVMVGNIITPDGMRGLYNAGADLIRCGISTGQLCITGDVTGVSMPAISMLENLKDATKGIYVIPPISPSLIMDGGIRNSGDIVKSLIAGADAVMIGTLFGRTKESEHEGTISGMASKAHQIEYYHTTKSIEGISKAMVKDTTVRELMSDLSWGIMSACTYVNAINMAELKKYGRLICIK